MNRNWSPHNWLVHRIHDSVLTVAIDKYANGVLLDIGCGEKPYRTLTEGRITAHFGLDHPSSFHSRHQVDIFGTAYETGLGDISVDTVLCTVVMEHLERPQDALIEMHRILKPGGHIILTAPLFWHLHEEPRDFYRYTKYGLAHLFTTTGFEIIEIKPLSGFVVTFSQELVYFLNYLRRGPLRYPVSVMQTMIQALAYGLNRWDRSTGFTWAYLAVGRKP
ncbi:MAG: hypothetical protein AMXMBFR16_11840 [Candidatus Uhrbacteria bacterium]